MLEDIVSLFKPIQPISRGISCQAKCATSTKKQHAGLGQLKVRPGEKQDKTVDYKDVVHHVLHSLSLSSKTAYDLH